VLSTRLPGGLVPDTDFLELAPDIVGEVVSPHDEAEDVAEKVQEFLAAGVRLIWVAYPRNHSVYVYRADGSYEALGEQDELDGSPALPGFRLPISALFKRHPPK
jgi:Uma2 family endonuclease